MKKLGKLMLIGFIAMVGLTACNGGDDPVTPPIVDDRDQFVGSYSLTEIGSLSVIIDGQTNTLPADGTGFLYITKSSVSSSIVDVTGYFDCQATVSGNTIMLDPITETETDPETGLSLVGTTAPKRGTLSGSTLTFLVDYSGTLYANGSSYPVSGTTSVVCTKQ